MQEREDGVEIIGVRAANPSAMTGEGTISFVLRAAGTAMVLDPGPDLPAHLAAIEAALAGHRLAAVLVSHAHLDHSALAPRLASRQQAPVLAFGGAHEGQSPQMAALAAAGFSLGAEGLDRGFAPDDRLVDGQSLALGPARLQVLHTPGHLGGHLCFGLGRVLFSGDHIMGWSSTLVAPPEGDMRDYMASLARLSQGDWRRILPAHGAPIEDPAARINALTAHRRAREAEVLAALRGGPASAQDLAERIYTQTPKPLMPAAAASVLAHLIALWQTGEARPSPPFGPTSRFALC